MTRPEGHRRGEGRVSRQAFKDVEENVQRKLDLGCLVFLEPICENLSVLLGLRDPRMKGWPANPCTRCLYPNLTLLLWVSKIKTKSWVVRC